MKTYKEILNNKSTQQIRLITIHNILNDIDMNLLTEKQNKFLLNKTFKFLMNSCQNILTIVLSNG